MGMKWPKFTNSKKSDSVHDQNSSAGQSEENASDGDLSGAENKRRKSESRFSSAARKAVLVAAVVIVVVMLISAYLYSLANNRNITVVTSVGNITFTDKQREGDYYYAAFKAADYNMIPEVLNGTGVMVAVDSDTYNALALDVEYAYANVVFTLPRSAARKAGYVESQANVQVLWQKDILEKYARIQSVIWSGSY